MTESRAISALFESTMTDRDGPPETRRARVGMATSIAVAVTLLAGQALAQDQAAIEKLVQMNKKALDDYDTLEWESAKRTLLDALMAGKKAGLANHAIMARTYVHLGAVYVTGFKDRDKAIQSFIRALEIDPSIQLSRGIATQEVNGAFAEARRQRGGGGIVTPPAPPRPPGPVTEGEERPAPPKKKTQKLSVSDDSGEKDLPVHITALDCPNEDEAIIDRTATLRCALEQTPVLRQVASVFLIYQEPGKDKYTEVEMTKTARGWYVGKIPKKTVNGKSIRYYFEGRNVEGKTIVTNGEEANPLILLLMTEEAYRKSKEKKPDRRGPDTENPLIVPEGPDRFGNRKWWIGIGAGSGFGYAKGQGLEAVNRSPDPMFNKLASEFVPGGAWAGLLHLAPEIGYQISPNVAISIEGRFQYVSPAGAVLARCGEGGHLRVAQGDAVLEAGPDPFLRDRHRRRRRGLPLHRLPGGSRRTPRPSRRAGLQGHGARRADHRGRGCRHVLRSVEAGGDRRRGPRPRRLPDLLVRGRREPGATDQLLLRQEGDSARPLRPPGGERGERGDRERGAEVVVRVRASPAIRA